MAKQIVANFYSFIY